MFAAVGFSGVADHFIAVSIIEVHVDVRHRFASWVQESLEQEVVFDWVEVGDLEAICNRATCRGSSTGSNSDSVVAGVTDQVPSNQKV